MEFFITSQHEATALIIEGIFSGRHVMTAAAQYRFALRALAVLDGAWESYSKQLDGLTTLAEFDPTLADDCAGAACKLRALREEVSYLIDAAETLLADAEEELKLDWLLTH